MQNRSDGIEIKNEIPEEPKISVDRHFTDEENLLIHQIVEELGSTEDAKELEDYKTQLKSARSKINILEEEVDSLKKQLTKDPKENVELISPPSSVGLRHRHSATQVSQNKKSFFKAKEPKEQDEKEDVKVRDSCFLGFCVIL